MAKPVHSDAPSASGNGSRPMIEALQPEAVAENCNRLLRHMEEINRAWIGTLQQANESTWTLAGHLARCSDPMEANRLCTDWFSERREAMLNDGKRLSEMWLKLCEQDLAAPVRSLMSEVPSSMNRMAAAE